ncbi:hypothetical protein DFR31_1903 [Alkalispirillum mobile]|uniref:Uncharacterized protein n=1 Tax=Alkalispirillum mobile TaxID=85925 RepID=A0A498C902_9GAMM|nr:hypothetical protein [Alkalispirillum mobile]RLK48791.1 hypothetical protein DFR31_1903 [Alkalispirillum mobile]
MHAAAALNTPEVPTLPAPGWGAASLVALSFLVMALTTYEVREPGTAAAVVTQPAVVEHLMEQRPHGPPPGFDADQLGPEEVEEVAPAVAADSAGGTGATAAESRSGDLRARPER